MKIFIDADGCPVVDITLRCAKANGFECIAVCDTAHEIKRDGLKTITVSSGNDSADFALANMVEKDDIVVTQDYGLAAMVLTRCARPITQNGLIIDDYNLSSLLHQRHISKKIRMAGGHTKGPSKRTRQQDEDFERQLLKLISR